MIRMQIMIQKEASHRGQLITPVALEIRLDDSDLSWVRT
jgi:hypothetical protein